MARSINKTIMSGRLAADPVLTQMSDGTSVARFSLALNYDDRVDYVNCVTFGVQADNLCKYVGKGGMVFIEGRFRQDSWIKNGKKVYGYSIVCEKVEFVSSGKKQETAPAQAASIEEQIYAEMGQNEVPF